MHFSTLRSFAGILLGCVCLLFPSAVGAQGQKPNRDAVRFETFDMVELKGTYWPGSKGRDSAVVIMLHKPNGRSDEDGWLALGDDLQNKGFAVLAFDFRGHGASTAVGEEFWAYPHNIQLIKGGTSKPSAISAADFQARYWPHLINDITAAKRFIERRYNDSGECNSSNIVLIGAEGGATLGTLWLATELKRFRAPNLIKARRSEGDDVSACVWLNMSGYIGPNRVDNLLKNWLKEAGNGRDTKIPMAFIYGKEDDRAKPWAEGLVKIIRPNYKPGMKPDPADELRGTLEFGVPGTKLTGSKLLDNALSTRKEIVENYLDKFIFADSKATDSWEKRELETTPYLWDFGTGRPVFCHLLDGFQRPIPGKNIIPVPAPVLQYFGIR